MVNLLFNTRLVVKLRLKKIQMQLTNIDSPRAGLMNHHKPLFIN